MDVNSDARREQLGHLEHASPVPFNLSWDRCVKSFKAYSSLPCECVSKTPRICADILRFYEYDIPQFIYIYTKILSLRKSYCTLWDRASRWSAHSNTAQVPTTVRKATLQDHFFPQRSQILLQRSSKTSYKVQQADIIKVSLLFDGQELRKFAASIDAVCFVGCTLAHDLSVAQLIFSIK